MTYSAPPPLTLLLDKIARASAQRLAQRLSDLEITPRHVGLLTAAASLRAPSQAELGAWLGVGTSAVVAIVDELETRGAVRRTPDPANRRRMIITVTREGASLLAEADRHARELDQDLVADLPPELTAAFSAATLMIAQRLGLTRSAGAAGEAAPGQPPLPS
jgi:DNA-binding MarR family transcriptional regulator